MLTDKLHGKLEEAKRLTHKLDRSLALEYLWPDAFNHGRARAHWFGPSTTEPTNYMRPNQPVHLFHEFHITDSKGNKMMFTYYEVPEILGGGLKEEMYRRVTNLTIG